jgi:HSP20 family protein
MYTRKCRALHDFEELFRDAHHHPMRYTSVDFATDVSEDENNLYVSIHVPGIKSDKIDIAVEDNTLRVTGERSEEHVTADKRYIRKEIQRGHFERTVALPCAVDDSKATAEIGDGVLHIALPKKSKMLGKKNIQIKRS